MRAAGLCPSLLAQNSTHRHAHPLTHSPTPTPRTHSTHLHTSAHVHIHATLYPPPQTRTRAAPTPTNTQTSSAHEDQQLQGQTTTPGPPQPQAARRRGGRWLRTRPSTHAPPLPSSPQTSDATHSTTHNTLAAAGTSTSTATQQGMQGQSTLVEHTQQGSDTSGQESVLKAHEEGVDLRATTQGGEEVQLTQQETDEVVQKQEQQESVSAPSIEATQPQSSIAGSTSSDSSTDKHRPKTKSNSSSSKKSGSSRQPQGTGPPFSSWQGLLSWLGTPRACRSPAFLATTLAFLQQSQQHQQQRNTSDTDMSGTEIHSSSSSSSSVRASSDAPDPGVVVLVLNQVAKVTTRQAALKTDAVEWEALQEVVHLIMAILHPYLTSTQTGDQTQASQVHSSSPPSPLSPFTLARLVRSLNMLLLLLPPAQSFTPQHASSTAPSQNSSRRTQQQSQQKHKQRQQPQQQEQPVLPLLPLLFVQWTDTLNEAVSNALRATQQPEELVVLLRALSLDGVSVAMGLKACHSPQQKHSTTLNASQPQYTTSSHSSAEQHSSQPQHTTASSSFQHSSQSPQQKHSTTLNAPQLQHTTASHSSAEQHSPRSQHTTASSSFQHSSQPQPQHTTASHSSQHSSQSTQREVAAAALDAVQHFLPSLSPTQCAICLSCVTLLEWWPPRAWVQAVTQRLEQVEQEAWSQHQKQHQKQQQQQQQAQQEPLKQPDKQSVVNKTAPVSQLLSTHPLQQHFLEEGEQEGVSQQQRVHKGKSKQQAIQQRPSQQRPSQQQQQQELILQLGPQKEQQKEQESPQSQQEQQQPQQGAQHQPMTVRDAEQVLVALAHLHMPPHLRLTDILLRTLAAAFESPDAAAPSEGTSSAQHSSTAPSTTTHTKLRAPTPPHHPYMPSASAAAAAALKVHSSPSNQTNPDQIISNASSDQAASALDHNQNSQNSFPSAALLTTRQQEPTNQPSAAQQKCNSTGQSGHTKSHSEESTTGHTLSPTQLSASLWAIASLGLRPPAPWLAAYMKATHSSLQEFSARTLAEVLWALATLRWEPSLAWMHAALSALEAKTHQLRAGEVAIAVWALSKLRFRASPALLTSLFAHATQPSLLSYLDGRALSMLMTACARTNYLPPASCMRPLAARLLLLLHQTAEIAVSGAPSYESSAGAASAGGRTSVTAGNASAQQQQQQQQSDQRSSSNGKTDLPLTPQGVANLAWAFEVRGLYTDYPEVVPALHAASLALMPHFSPVELGMLGLAVGNTLQAQHHARTCKKATSLPPLTPPTPQWISAFTEASHRILLQKCSTQQRSTAQLSTQQRSTAQRENSSAVVKGGGLRSNTGREGGGGDARFASSVFLGLMRMSLEGQHPPAEWMRTWYEVTGATLLTFNPRELELVCEGMRLMRPAPTPPLTWVRAFSDRRDVLSDHAGMNAHLRKQLLLVLRTMRHAWQARVAVEGGGARVGVKERRV